MPSGAARIPFLLLLLATILGAAARLPGQSAADGRAEAAAEEITVQLDIADAGAFYMTALFDGRDLFLPAADVFGCLRVRIDSAGDAVVAGYLTSEERPYRIDALSRTIEYTARRDCSGGELRTFDGRVYVRMDLFGEVFGLDCSFDMNGLEVHMRPRFEIPALQQMKRERARKNIVRDAETSFDRHVRPDWSALRPGVLEWSVGGLVDSLGARPAGFALGLGMMVLGGTFETRLAGTGDGAVDLRGMPWSWRYAADGPVIRQVTVGTMNAPLAEMVLGGAVGVSATNARSGRRSRYGVHVIDERTEPGWTVELWTGQRLVDFVVADSLGRFRFEVPIGYGVTDVALRFYGPWGEERVRERTLSIPHVLLPSGTVEYTTTLGTIQEGAAQGALFGDVRVQAGLADGLTFGGGLTAYTEGRSGASPSALYPFVGGSILLLDRALLSARYAPGIENSADLSWVASPSAHVSASYSERPRIIGGAHAGNTRTLTVNAGAAVNLLGLQSVFALRARGVRTEISAAECDISMSTRMFGMPVALSSRVAGAGPDRLLLVEARSEARVGINAFGVAGLRAMFGYDWFARRVGRIGLEAQRNVEGVHISLGAEHEPVSGRVTLQLGLSVDMPFARVSTVAISDGSATAVRSSASGSVMLDAAGGSVLASPNGAVRRGAVTFRPFLDVNDNGRPDSAEPAVSGLDIAVNTGSVRRGDDSLIRVLDVDPDRPFTVTFSDAHLPDLSWRVRQRVWEVQVSAACFSVVDVPVIVAGEANGRVVRRRDGRDEGLAGVVLRFVREDGSVAASATTIESGEFIQADLPPGTYTVVPDPDQMRSLRLRSVETPPAFTLRSAMVGDIVEGLSIVVAP